MVNVVFVSRSRRVVFDSSRIDIRFGNLLVPPLRCSQVSPQELQQPAFSFGLLKWNPSRQVVGKNLVAGTMTTMVAVVANLGKYVQQDLSLLVEDHVDDGGRVERLLDPLLLRFGCPRSVKLSGFWRWRTLVVGGVLSLSRINRMNALIARHWQHAGIANNVH